MRDLEQIDAEIYQEVKRVLAESKTIIWTVPNFKDEAGEYLENVPTKEFLKSFGVSFNTESEVIDFLKSGKLADVTKEQFFTEKSLCHPR